MRKKTTILFSLGFLVLILSSTYVSAVKTYLGVKNGDSFDYSYYYQDDDESKEADIKISVVFISEGTSSATVNYTIGIKSDEADLMEDDGKVIEEKITFNEYEASTNTTDPFIGFGLLFLFGYLISFTGGWIRSATGTEDQLKYEVNETSMLAIYDKNGVLEKIDYSFKVGNDTLTIKIDRKLNLLLWGSIIGGGILVLGIIIVVAKKSSSGSKKKKKKKKKKKR
jgi:hypothetical protein